MTLEEFKPHLVDLLKRCGILEAEEIQVIFDDCHMTYGRIYLVEDSLEFASLQDAVDNIIPKLYDRFMEDL